MLLDAWRLSVVALGGPGLWAGLAWWRGALAAARALGVVLVALSAGSA